MGFQKGNKFKLENSRSAVLVKCYQCGATSHKTPVCRHKATVCSQCRKVGHLKRVCRSTTENKVSQVEVCSMNKNSTDLEKLGTEEHYEQLSNVNIRGHLTQSYRIKVQINRKLHEFGVDSGVALTIVNHIVFENIWPNVRNRPELAPCNVSLAVWGGKRVHVYGQELVVADSAGRSLLGRNWFGDLGISVQGLHVGPYQLYQFYKEMGVLEFVQTTVTW
ncbi:hypothetical protein PR048_023937 [Dryococelus australis]|uniref:CCHC-type domain-containing protein n=1 Tax=Dryococelus australis TaxID=614101 RepID=A0ABQ9GVI7_9NEOP|nr:hypothetical protein PR048_023937 [Dryococelus australis]